MAILSLSPARSIAAGPPRFASVPPLSAAAAVYFIGRPLPVVQQPEQVYALPGTLGAAQSQSYTVYLQANTGQTYGLYGETPDVERQIADLQGQGPGLLVKVWGTLYPEGRQSSGPEIVVSAIEASVQEGGIGAPPPSGGSSNLADRPTATGRFDYVNIRSGPGSDYPIVGELLVGQTCPAIGRNEINSWIMIRCPAGLTGWVPSTVVELGGDLSQIPLTLVEPIVTPTPPPPAFLNWKASYFGNRDLAGEPLLVQDVAAVNFNWGVGSPDPASVPVDNFSARYERILNFAPGTYRLCLCDLDDGARLWIDGQLILNDWREGASRDLFVDRQMNGDHAIVVEYFEATNLASIHFTSEVAVRARNEWEAKYWNNTGLEGPPALVRTEPKSAYPLERNWGAGSPQPGLIGDDFWSASWRAIFYFQSGDYLFNVISDDGVRVYVDGYRIIDAWQDGRKEISRQVTGLSQGDHEVFVEYYERAGEAYVRVWWYQDLQVRDE